MPGTSWQEAWLAEVIPIHLRLKCEVVQIDSSTTTRTSRGVEPKEKSQPPKRASPAVTLAASSLHQGREQDPFPKHICLVDGDQHRVMFRIVVEHRYLCSPRTCSIYDDTNSRVVFENV